MCVIRVCRWAGGLAALLVVLHHTVGRMHIAGIGEGVLPGFLFGFLGVDFFFVLSGFIIAHTLSNPGLSAFEFAARRAIRVLGFASRCHARNP